MDHINKTKVLGKHSCPSGTCINTHTHLKPTHLIYMPIHLSTRHMTTYTHAFSVIHLLDFHRTGSGFCFLVCGRYWLQKVTGIYTVYIHKMDGQPPPTTYLSPDYPLSLDDFEMQDSRWSGGKKSRAKHSCFHLLVRAIATFLFTLMGSVRAQRENKQQPLHLSADVLLKYSHYCGVFMWYSGTCFLDVAVLFLVP